MAFVYFIRNLALLEVIMPWDQKKEDAWQRSIFPNADLRGEFDKQYCPICELLVQEIDYCEECKTCNEHCSCFCKSQYTGDDND